MGGGSQYPTKLDVRKYVRIEKDWVRIAVSRPLMIEYPGFVYPPTQKSTGLSRG